MFTNKIKRLAARARASRKVRKNENPHGFFRVYEPENGQPCAEIVLVHGLGGTSQNTWTWPDDPHCFWPREMCNLDPLQMARVWTHGYPANGLKRPMTKSVADINDFAEDFLNHLKDEVDKLPIIFIAHSLGGIVVKKACVLGANNQEYQDVISSACAVFFLGTPHKGATIADKMISCLKFFCVTAAPHVTPLRKDSPEFEEIHDDFKPFSERLEIATFYELEKMDLFGLGAQMVVDKWSSITPDLPNQVLVPMFVNHRNIARFPNISDPAPRKLIRRIQRSVRQHGPWTNDAWRLSSGQKSDLIKKYLGAESAPDAFSVSPDNIIGPGTCDWVLLNTEFQALIDDLSVEPRILWFHGLVGSGKSVLASFVSHWMKSFGKTCLHFSFRDDDPKRRSVISLFKSLAFQLVDNSRQFQDHVASLAHAAETLDDCPSHFVWKRLLAAAIENIDDVFERPVYWIIDGLDICDDPEALISGLADEALSRTPIKVVILSRRTRALAQLLDDKTTQVDMESLAEKRNAVGKFVEANLGRSNPHTPHIIETADGNFLGARLLVNYFFRQAESFSLGVAVDAAQAEFAIQWKALITHEASMWSSEQSFVARQALTWITYAKDPLEVEQLVQAIAVSTAKRVEPRDIGKILGPLVTIDECSKVRLCHRSLRQFLLTSDDPNICSPFHRSHTKLLVACIREILGTDTEAKGISASSGLSRLGVYATMSWHHHLHLVDPANQAFDDEVLSLLEEFMTGPGISSWIFLLSELGRVDLMASAADALLRLRTSLVGQAKKSGLDDILRSWAIELIQLLGRFGGQLTRHPRMLFSVVPSFCPQSSLLRAQMRRKHQSFPILVQGISNIHWGDIIARLTVSQDPDAVVCSPRYIAVSSGSTDEVFLISTLRFIRQRTIKHEESIRMMRFSTSGTMLATYGNRAVKVWHLDSDRPPWVFAVPATLRPLDMTFRSNDLAVLVCAEDGDIWEFSIPALAASTDKAVAVWDSVAIPNPIDAVLELPECVSFNSDGSMIAVSYHNLPITSWRIPTSRGCLHRQRSEPLEITHDVALSPVTKIQWLSSCSLVLFLRCNGSVWTWDPNFQTICQLTEFGIMDIRGCSNRPFFVTSDGQGNLKVRRAIGTLLASRTSGSGMPIDFAICPEGRNVYELHYGRCDVWTPMELSLQTLDVAERTALALHKESRVMEIGHQEQRDHIELLSMRPENPVFCAAYARGRIQAMNDSLQPIASRSSPGFITVTNIAWGHSENYLAITDVTNVLSVFFIEDGTFVEIASLQLKDSGTTQLLFKPDDSSLLVVSQRGLYVWAFKEDHEPKIRAETDVSSYWINHPFDGNYLFGFCPTRLLVLKWSGLLHVTASNFCCSETPIANLSADLDVAPRTETGFRVNKVHLSTDLSHIFICISHFEDSGQSGLIRIAMNNICSCILVQSDALSVYHYQGPLLDRLGQFLGTVHNSRGTSDSLVFLDQNGWLCTLSDEGTVQEHLPLPHDWLDPESTKLAKVTPDGAVIIPKDGKIGVIKGCLELTFQEGESTARKGERTKMVSDRC